MAPLSKLEWKERIIQVQKKSDNQNVCGGNVMQTSNKKEKPALEGLFSWPSETPALIGSRCRSCKTYVFPKSSTCSNPNCEEKQPEEVSLSTKGKLWSYTVHYYEPPPPFKYKEPFEPFGIGVIELPEGIKILSMLTTSDPKALKIGMDMELLIDKMYEDEEGNECLTWKFKPIRG
jgi:uncharacterized protein